MGDETFYSQYKGKNVLIKLGSGEQVKNIFGKLVDVGENVLKIKFYSGEIKVFNTAYIISIEEDKKIPEGRYD